jgi:[acyl-carrier-protein] S-malonyltransferase
MQPAQELLRTAIEAVDFTAPSCPIYQNVSAQPTSDPAIIQKQLIEQLTSPVKWTQTMERMIADGVSGFVEVGGRGGILTGFMRRIDRTIPAESV